jgi:hypothetical protein
MAWISTSEVIAMESLKPVEPGEIEFKTDAISVLDERWSDQSPEEGTELCVCSWCGQMIGRGERDPVWEDHIEYCGGCEVCEIAVRVWKDTPEKKAELLELRFHSKCVNEIMVKQNG